MKMFTIVLLLFAGMSISVYADEAIEVYYEERAPYAVIGAAGFVRGLTATPVNEAFSRAGIRLSGGKFHSRDSSSS